MKNDLPDLQPIFGHHELIGLRYRIIQNITLLNFFKTPLQLHKQNINDKRQEHHCFRSVENAQ